MNDYKATRWGWRQWAAVILYTISGACAELAARLDVDKQDERPVL